MPGITSDRMDRVSVVILQFDQASITPVGVLVGFMFAFAGSQNFLLAGMSEGAMRWGR